jgi:thymidylate kinase
VTGLLVELLGLPGSGKTALAREACPALRSRGLDAVVVDRPISAAVPRTARVVRRTAASARTTLRRPAWTLGSAAQIASVREPTRRDTVSVLAQWLAVCDLAARSRRDGGVHLLEEGPLQTLWTLMLRSPDPLPEGLLTRFPPAARSDLVVVLDVPVEVVEERLHRRASRHSRSQRLDSERTREELEHGRRLVDDLVARTTTPVLRLRGGETTTPTGLAGLLADVLAAHPRALSN